VTPILFAITASQELEAAIRWYEERREGLGAELYDATVAGIELIATHPEIGVLRPGPVPTRQLVLQRFPYKIVYRVRAHDLYVVAIAHTSRSPGYWRDRQ
jgi:plasmid stabilization system protein ParE